MLTTPIYTGEINDKPVRFFKHPGDEIDFPWSSWNDLLGVTNYPREVRERFTRDLQQGPFRSDSRTIATERGLEIVVQHGVAQGLFGAAVATKRAPASVEADYARVAAVALGVLTDRSSLNFMDFLKIAIQRSKGASN